MSNNENKIIQKEEKEDLMMTTTTMMPPQQEDVFIDEAIDDDNDIESNNNNNNNNRTNASDSEGSSAAVAKDLEATTQGSTSSRSDEDLVFHQQHVVVSSTVEAAVHGDTVGASLPSSEELKAAANSSSRGLSKRPGKVLYMAMAGILVLALVIGLAVGISKSKSSSNNRRNMNMSDLTNHLRTKYNINFESQDTPQYQAAKWMAQEDPANLAMNRKSPADEYSLLTRYVLAVLYFSTTSTDDNDYAWESNIDFLSEDHACWWYGAVKINQQEDMLAGVDCTKDTDIIKAIRIPYNNLAGTIPTELGLLTTLERLDLYNNHIRGTIPTELCKLTSLQNVALGYNQLSGSLPECMGDALSQLEMLYVSNNQLHGALPSSLTKLAPTLKRLLLDDNMFTGDPTEIWSQLTNLRILAANTNQFVGSLQENWLKGWKDLEILDLSDNQFLSDDQGIPQILFTNMPNLRALDLSKNLLTGPAFPNLAGRTDLEQPASLQFLSLYGNRFTGPLLGGSTSDTLYMKLLAQLQHLDVSNNRLNGTIPATIGHFFPQLRVLFLSNNPTMDESTAIPDSVSKLSNLQDLALRNTNRQGPLPDILGGMVNLTLIDFGGNAMTGTVPESWGQLTNLEFLLLHRNPAINGNLPDSVSKWTNLRAAFLDGTKISGSFNKHLCKLPAFANEVGRANKINELFADCGPDANMVQCDCCQCCLLNSPVCSDPNVANLDANWENDFQRISYTFTNDTYYFENNPIV